MKKFKQINFLIFFLLSVLFLSPAGCGYYNPNMLPDDEQGPTVKFYVPMWNNPTNELALESRIQNAIQNWLIQSKRIILTNADTEHDYIMEGSITSVQYPGRSYDEKNTATALKAILSVTYSITEKKTGKKIWSESKSLEETYSLGGSTAATDANKKRALDLMVDDLGEHIYIRTYKALSRHQRRGGSGKAAGEKPGSVPATGEKQNSTPEAADKPVAPEKAK